MASSLDNNQLTPSQFSLKHRLIGAGILISFGVIILPWMLGSYSDEKITSPNVEQQRTSKSSSGELLADNASTEKKTDEKKTDKKSNLAKGTKLLEKNSSDSESKVKVFVSRVQPLNSDDDQKNKQVNKPKPVKTVSSPKPVTQSVSKKVAASKDVVTTNSNKPSKTVSPKTPATPAPKVATSKVDETPKSANDINISRGYIVSVGVFGDVKNVDKMIVDLKTKSFQPLVRKETFNKKSVSRIYMGPFKTRAEAGKVKLRLSEKGISKTLIKEFP